MKIKGRRRGIFGGLIFWYTMSNYDLILLNFKGLIANKGLLWEKKILNRVHG